MSTSDDVEFKSAPTPGSKELLARILMNFPTLQLILFYSHRQDIIHLARTCRAFNSILTTSVAPLCSPFPSCTLRLRSCRNCQAIVCARCRQLVRMLEKPFMVRSELWLHKAIVIAPFAQRVKTKDLDVLQATKILLDRSRPSDRVHVMQGVGVQTLCSSCATLHNNSCIPGSTLYWANKQYIVPELQRYVVPTLQWDDVQTTHTRCICTLKNRAQCTGDKNLVAIENVPIKSKLVALVELPQELKSGSEDVEFCAMYLTASG
ncbi:hypothetical protein BGX38DRAFT_1226300 [Terfezia claveryi]|nr:hypothetical protein BGX38DRAFT_1226300 [Terfezia claveryi]